jgi:hypothetical protein
LTSTRNLPGDRHRPPSRVNRARLKRERILDKFAHLMEKPGCLAEAPEPGRLLGRGFFLITIALLVPVSAKDRDDVVAVLDFEDFTRLDGRKLSLGSHGYAQM